MNYGNPYNPQPNQGPTPLWRPQAPDNPAGHDPYSPPRPLGGMASAAPPASPRESFSPGAWFGDLLFVVALVGGALLLAYAIARPFFSMKDLVG